MHGREEYGNVDATNFQTFDKLYFFQGLLILKIMGFLYIFAWVAALIFQ